MSGAIADRVVGVAADPDRRSQALTRANQIRFERIGLRRDLKARRIKLPSLVLAPPPFAEGMTVGVLLRAVPRIGHQKSSEILHELRMSTRTTLADLSSARRQELSDYLLTSKVFR
jgi:hypothetical protein